VACRAEIRERTLGSPSPIEGTNLDRPAGNTREQYDVFISYNHADKALALRFHAELKKRDLVPFIDQAGTDWGLAPGEVFYDGLQKALQLSRGVAVLVGPSGLGNTQTREMQFALAEQDRRGQDDVKVFRVLLPGALEPSSNDWLGLRTRVDLRNAIDDAEQFAGILKAVPPRAPTPRIPRTPPTRTDSFDTVVKALADKLQKGTVTFFVGPGACRPPSPYGLAHRLTELLRERTDPNLPPIPTVELACACLAVESQDEHAPGRELYELLRTAPARHDPDVPTDVAKFLRKFCDTYQRVPSVASAAERGFRRPTPSAEPILLIVATTYDLSIEEALVREQLPFRRLVQWTARPRIDSADFDPTDRGPDRAASATDIDRWLAQVPSESIEFPLGARGKQPRNPLPGVSLRPPSAPQGFHIALYKPLGSLDCEGSCAISVDQHYRMALNVSEGHVPEAITHKVRNDSLVFLGYSIFDSSYRVLSHTLLRDRVGGPSCYIVRPQPAADEQDFESRLEAPLWESVRSEWTRRQARLVDLHERDFLDHLSSRCGLA
jgi:hypothetical protein